MPSEVILPRVDMDMATGKISKWLVDDGAPVRKGQPLFEIETDKAAMEIEAEASGTVRTLARAGTEDVAVGSVVALIYRDGENAAYGSEGRTAAGTALPPTDAIRPEPAAGAPSAPEAPRATPLARRLARERGHDLAALKGSGPRGRVMAADVPAPATPKPLAAAADPGAEEARAIPVAAVSAPARPSSAVRGLATLRDGAGAPLVLLHGFGADLNAWRPALQGYGGRRPVLALDLPGHGGTRLGPDASFAALVDQVEAALSEAQPGRFTLVGHSLGAAVAAAVAARGAIDAAALVLIAPAGLGPEINGGFIRGFLDATSEAALAPWLRELVADPSLVTPSIVRLSLQAREPAREDQRRIAAAVFPDGTQAVSIRADLARIACPLRVVVGMADRIIPPRHADALPPLAALHRLPGVGHMPQIEARPILQAILAEVAGP